MSDKYKYKCECVGKYAIYYVMMRNSLCSVRQLTQVDVRAEPLIDFTGNDSRA